MNSVLLAIIAMLMVYSPAFAGDSLTFRKVNAKTISVHGDIEELVSFMYRYQDNQFPAWRGNKSVVQSINDAEKHLRELTDSHGSVSFYVGEDAARKAFVEAIR